MDKVTKASVNYRRAAPSSSKRCETCVMFRRRLVPFAQTGHCTLVAGQIDTRDVCDRWEDRP